MGPPQNHYTVLALPTPSRSSLFAGSSASAVSARDVKAAYRRALLRWHPDKAGLEFGTGIGKGREGGKGEGEGEGLELRDKRREGNGPSVDDITAAYRVLSSPEARRAFEKGLLAYPAAGSSSGPGADAAFHTGLEVMDLDDLAYEEGGDGEGMWFRACRCGEERGFVVHERQLVREEEAGGREVLVGCGGCSLWLRVGFGVVGEEGEGGTEGG